LLLSWELVVPYAECQQRSAIGGAVKAKKEHVSVAIALVTIWAIGHDLFSFLFSQGY